MIKVLKQNMDAYLAFLRRFENVTYNLYHKDGAQFCQQKDCVTWINPKAKRRKIKNGNYNLNYYAFDQTDFTELNKFLYALDVKEQQMREQGYNMDGIKSFNRNIWMDISRESSAIEDIIEDFSFDLLDFRTKLKGKIFVDPPKGEFDEYEYFKLLLSQFEKIKNNENDFVIEGNKQKHKLKIETIGHFIAFKYMYHCAKAAQRKVNLSEDEFEEVLKNSSALISGNFSLPYRHDNAQVTDVAWTTVKPKDICDRMKSLCEWVTSGKLGAKLHPIEQAAIFHAEFIRIHPFADGNGRTGRIMSNYILIKNGVPTVAMRNVNRQNYYKAINKAIETHEVDDLIGIFTNAVWESARKIDECLDYIASKSKPSSKAKTDPKTK